jgi:molecular chaperone GrpE (heat shock protein)
MVMSESEGRPESEDRVVASEPSAGRGSDEMSPEELLDRLRRERADFVNYKRRVDRERGEDARRARAEMVLEVLPVLDELERALSQPPADLETHPWVQGVAIMHRTLLEAFKRLGVVQIGKPGDLFDPELHEALHYEPQAGMTDQRVAQVIKPGYLLDQTVVRPAQVTVVGPPATANNADADVATARSSDVKTPSNGQSDREAQPRSQQATRES